MGDGLQLLRDLGRTRRILIVDADEFAARHPPEQPRVVEAEGPGADDADPDRPPRRAHTNTPRWDPSMNLRKLSTSGVWGSSARAFAIPWLTVMSELNSRRYARFSASFTSGEKAARCSPTELRPYRCTGLPTALVYGGTSWFTREPPPTKAKVPMRTNWWIGTSPLMIARSSTVTWPAICTALAMITSLPTAQSCAMCT